MKDFFDDLPMNYESGTPHKHQTEGYDSYLSMGEYEELRLMLAGAKAAFAQEDNDITPDPAIQKNIRAMVAARKKGFEMPSFSINWQKILNHPLPAYQFGLAMILVLFMAMLVGRNIGMSSAKTTVVYKTDTIFEKAQKSTLPASYLSDSDTKSLSPGYSGSYFADSVDYNIDDNTGTNNPAASPAGTRNNPDVKDLSPGYQKINRPLDMDSPVKGGGLIEDSSKGNKVLHGLL